MSFELPTQSLKELKQTSHGWVCQAGRREKLPTVLLVFFKPDLPVKKRGGDEGCRFWWMLGGKEGEKEREMSA